LPFRGVPREGKYLSGIPPSRAPCGNDKTDRVIVKFIFYQALILC